MTAEADELREQAAQHEAEAAASFERCDTDGFLTQWAHGINAAKAQREAELVEAGGTATFGVDELFRNGEQVEARKLPTQYGETFKLDAPDENGREWIGIQRNGGNVTRPRQAEGYEIRERLFVAEAAVRLRGADKTNVRPVVEPRERKTDADEWVNWDRVVGLGDCTDEGG